MNEKKEYRRGFRNDYRKGMPLPEMVYKEILFAFQELGNFFNNGFRSKTLLAYPHFPSRHSALYKLCRFMNYNMTNRINRNFDIAIYYEDATHREQFAEMEELATRRKVINLYSRDISKQNVEKHFREVFGYSSFCDPTNFEGFCVKKSDANAAHDGEVVQCPVDKREPGYVYQKLLDNTTAGHMHEDIRIPVIAGQIPYVFLQYRLPENRFSIAKAGKLKNSQEVLSDQEKEKVVELSRRLNLDFGEMDVIRHKEDKKIYVIDVNNTPSTRARLFSKKAYRPFLDKQAEIFKQAFGAP
ncbi:MAG: hypothetical protein K9J27_00925 [Bacteroidales bacterium]|nr:hypothetical protein [Bacteroidales bacterium]MCF8332526.1 hypothetical protein [Bacteroidales bacterium]